MSLFKNSLLCISVPEQCEKKVKMTRMEFILVKNCVLELSLADLLCAKQRAKEGGCCVLLFFNGSQQGL